MATTTTKTSPSSIVLMSSSAFSPASPPSQVLTCDNNNTSFPVFPQIKTVDNDLESETEDEEVKMNCAGGFRGADDYSDMNSSHNPNTMDDDDDESLDDDDEEISPEKNQGVVDFISLRVPQDTLPVIKPKACTPGRRLSPHEEEEDDASKSDDDESSCSSVGARGVPFQLTPSAAALSEDAMDRDDMSTGSDTTGSSDNDDDDSTTSSQDVQDDLVPDESSPEVVVTTSRDVTNEPRSALEDNDPVTPTTEPEDLDASERFIGVMEDGQEQQHELFTLPLKNTKRVLSFNTLITLDTQARGKKDTPKRLKSTEMPQQSLLSSFSLGAPAMPEDSTPHVRLSLRLGPQSQQVISTTTQEHELDQQLDAELDDSERTSGNMTPIPLLTPPGSPLTVDLEDGDTTTVCEWPCNLAIDRAMATAASEELRPLSPASLEDLEERHDEEEPVSSNLTPLLRGIYVGD